MKKYLTADWHLGETRMEIMMRSFTDPNDQTLTLLDNHNRLVQPDDLVYHLGDVISKSHDPALRQEYLETISSFHGRKILVRGNHDENFSDKELSPYFEQIIPHGDGILLDSEPDMPMLWLTHYPTRTKENCFNLVGHIHSAWKFQLNSLNVGVDVHNFYPVPFSRLPFLRGAIDFYDNDVWAAYVPANEAYRGKRGKAGSYFGPHTN